MNQPLNPYESPVIPPEAASAVEPIGVVASFVMTEADLWRSACVNLAPTPRWVYWCAPLFIIVLGILVIAIEVTFGMLGLFVAGMSLFAVIVVVQTIRNRRVARQTLALMRAHPLLGTTGDWKLTVDRSQFWLQTPGGSQSYPRATTPFLAVEGQLLIIWFEPQLPIIIPEGGAYVRMGRLLRGWLRKTAAAS